jgi:hypothetical protein
MPDRKYRGFWHRILHDQTADGIERDVSQLAHANVTTVPFHLSTRHTAHRPEPVMPAGREPAVRAMGVPFTPGPAPQTATNGHWPIAAVTWRQHVRVAGRVRTVRVQRVAGSAALELVIEDSSGALSVVFLGRKALAGVEVGSRLTAEGTVGMHRDRLAILNPVYSLLPRSGH